MLPLPISSLRAASPVLRNPLNVNRAVPLTYEQFRYSFANAVSEDEAKELYATFAVPTSGEPLFQAAAANLNPWTEAKVDTKNPKRGALLIMDGEKDHTVPWAIANASYKRQARNKGVTEIVKIPNRGHALTIDNGWREVADMVLAFVRKHGPKPPRPEPGRPERYETNRSQKPGSGSIYSTTSTQTPAGSLRPNRRWPHASSRSGWSMKSPDFRTRSNSEAASATWRVRRMPSPSKASGPGGCDGWSGVMKAIPCGLASDGFR